jgi:hypothetical protein
MFNPPSGATVIMPTLVAMICNVSNTAIRYTTDGTDPTSSSTLYTVPVSIDSQYTQLKARAFIVDCDPGPVATVNYLVHSVSTWEFGYLCETGDFAGGFNEFAANGTANDYQFVLTAFLTEAIELVSIEIFQTDATGFWDSGQCWGTKEWLQPFENDPSFTFRTYPIVIRNKLNTTQWYTEYKTTLGPVVAGGYQYRLWGQPSTVLNGYFLCRITLGDGTVIKKLINTTCVGSATVIDPPCTAPSAPGYLADCTPNVALDFSVGAGVSWKVFRNADGLGWSELSSGVADGTGLVGYNDGSVLKCHTYAYYVSKLCSGLWYDSPSTGSIPVCSQPGEYRSLPDTISLIYTVPNPPGADVSSAPMVLSNTGFKDLGSGLYQMSNVSYAGNDDSVKVGLGPGLCEDDAAHLWEIELQSIVSSVVLFHGYLDSLQPTGGFVKTAGAYISAVTS